ncbi:MAG: hypothetical protein EOO40_03030, partial [Deltaproteobacteria bacterium]
MSLPPSTPCRHLFAPAPAVVPALRRLCLLTLLLGGGCGLLSGGQPPGVGGAAGATQQGWHAEASDDPEAGVRHLQSLLHSLREATAQGRFDQAEALVNTAEQGLAHSSTVTRSHPDFDDLQAQVKGARPQLREAIEADRLARRHAAIEALVRDGGADLRQCITQ